MSDDPQQPPAEDVDATRRMPRAEDAATTRQEPAAAAVPVWSGRAGVPPPRPAGHPDADADWYAEEQAGRRWWMPILLGVLALVLIALIGIGGWLVLRATERDSGPTPVPSVVPSTPLRTSAAPGTTAPSTAPPTTAPTTTAPAEVPMPPLVGLPESAARSLLDGLAVDYRVERRTSDRPPGTVIETDPDAGEPVAEGDEVTIVVAEAAASASAGTPTSDPTATATP